MMKEKDLNRPLVEIFYAEHAEAEYRLAKISEGIEEEGIPYRFSVQPTDSGGIVELSSRAAHASLLEVGIGMDQQGNIALHYRKLPDDTPLFKLLQPCNDVELRRFGSHAARLVKGLPFRLDEE